MKASLIMDIGNRYLQQDAALFDGKVYSSDRIFTTKELSKLSIMAVADGIGSLQNSKSASVYICNAFNQYKTFNLISDGAIFTTIIDSSSYIYNNMPNAGTTFSLIAIDGNILHYISIGDSFLTLCSSENVYVIEDGNIENIATSKTLRNMVSNHFISDYIGKINLSEKNFYISTIDLSAYNFHRAILATDGFYKSLYDEHNLKFIFPHDAEHDEILIELKIADAEDNYTAIIIDF